MTLQWSKDLPSIYAVTNGSGTVGIYSLHDFLNPTIAQSKSKSQTSPELLPPRWLRREVGVAFGFGGKLVTFGGSANSLELHQVVECKEEIPTRVREFDSLFEGHSLEQVCGIKASHLVPDPS